MALDGHDEKRQDEKFGARYENTCDEYNDRQMPRSRRPEVDHAAEDRVGLCAEQGTGMHDRQYICRDEEDIACDQQRPGARDAVRLPKVKMGPALETAGSLAAWDGFG